MKVEQDKYDVSIDLSGENHNEIHLNLGGDPRGVDVTIVHHRNEETGERFISLDGYESRERILFKVVPIGSSFSLEQVEEWV